MIRIFLILWTTILFGALAAQPLEINRKGKDYALFFAVDQYEDPVWQDLQHPIRDAETLAALMEQEFGFETEIHQNPTRQQILDVISLWQQKTFAADAQLFIFFSGHGKINSVDSEGYFMPSDARKSEGDYPESEVQQAYENHLALIPLTRLVHQISCPHILVSVDGVFSNLMLDQYQSDLAYEPYPFLADESEEAWTRKFLKRQLNKTSRILMMSGVAAQKVPPGMHSAFTEGLLTILSREPYISHMVSVRELTGSLREIMKQDPLLRYGYFDGHISGGGFVFVRQKEAIRMRETDRARLNPSGEAQLPKMIKINGGSFEMGYHGKGQDEQPSHLVKVSDFYISQTEITTEQYFAYLSSLDQFPDFHYQWYKMQAEIVLIRDEKGHFILNPKKAKEPIANISWHDAQAYCNWLSEATGDTYRLPTEAEWEYAAGGGTRQPSIWAGTNDERKLNHYANWQGPKWYDYYEYRAPVGSFEPNALGLYDMSGNVWEWCQDYYGENYYQYCVDNQIVQNPLNKEKSEKRVIRGGGNSSLPNLDFFRVANRSQEVGTERSSTIGFRVVREK